MLWAYSKGFIYVYMIYAMGAYSIGLIYVYMIYAMGL